MLTPALSRVHAAVKVRLIGSFERDTQVIGVDRLHVEERAAVQRAADGASPARTVNTASGEVRRRIASTESIRRSFPWPRIATRSQTSSISCNK